MASPRCFTLEEANDLLPEVEPLMARLLETRAKVVRSRQQIDSIIEDTRSDVGGQFASEMTREFVVIEELMEKIQSYGCVIKSTDAGLLDFLARREGRLVYLCWRYGEPKIEFYHELHKGFNGRRRI
jgi:hypothetical protein